jgi:hypothetical protein
MATRQPTGVGQRVSEEIIRRTKGGRQLAPGEYDQIIMSILGGIDKSGIPEGSQILEENANQIRYRDPQGFIHTLSRNLDANLPDFGRVSEKTDRPNVLPLTQQIPGLSGALQGAIDAVNRMLTDRTTLAELPPEVLEALETQNVAERSRISRESEIAQGKLIAGLFGKGAETSTIATGASSELASNIGRLFLEQEAGAAQRKIDLQKFLTEAGLAEQQTEAGFLANFLNSITSQETTRATEGARIGLGREQIEAGREEAMRNFMLEWEKFQASQNKSKLPGILSAAISLAAAPFTGGTSLLGLASGGLQGLLRGSAGQPGMTPPFNPSGGTPFGLG